MKKSLHTTFFTVLVFCFSFTNAQESVLWEVNNLSEIGGMPVTKYGNPKVVNFGSFNAIEFDGVDDGILLNQNPVANADAFTLEVVFMPYSGGETEQRFVHVQQDDDNRMLIELRSYNDEWFLDTFIKSGSANRALYAEDFLHANESWHHAALVYENGRMWHYVDGELEMDSTMAYVTQATGTTSLGMRQNFRSYFKGAIRILRASPSVLTPDQFLRADIVNSAHSLQSETFTIQHIGNTGEAKQSITLNVQKPGNYSITITTLTGQQYPIVSNRKLQIGHEQIELNIPSIKKGIYILQVSNNHETKSKKVFWNP